MLSSVSERQTRRVQAILFAAWLVLIASMFWDPLTPHLTEATARYSPFRIQAGSQVIQGKPIEVVPYTMEARIFWTMLVPVLPSMTGSTWWPSTMMPHQVSTSYSAAPAMPGASGSRRAMA